MAAPIHAEGLLTGGVAPVVGDEVDPEATESTKPAPPPPATIQPASKLVRVHGVWSQFSELPLAGDAPNTLTYGGKLDGYIDIGGSAFGADNSITVHVRPEFRYGEDSNGLIGLIPSNTELFYPGDGEVFDLSLSVTKRWKSGVSLTVGKVNVLDLAEHLPVIGGGGHEGFQNLAMALPPSAVVPAKITGVLLDVPTKKVLYRFWVFDPAVQSRRSGLEDPFDRGVAFLGSVTFPVNLDGKHGYYAVKLAGSTRSAIADDALPAVLVPGPGSTFGQRKGEMSVVLAAYQNVAEYPEAPGKGWGLFGQVYISRGDPTFLDRSALFGISGNPRARPQDRFGIAWFRYSLTNKLVDALSARLALEDEEGVEAFYTLQVAKPLRVTASLQVVDSAIAARTTGVLGSLRVSTRF
ncbi:MAG: carbohydrate porin [Sphingomonadaceae bacterium]